MKDTHCLKISLPVSSAAYEPEERLGRAEKQLIINWKALQVR